MHSEIDWLHRELPGLVARGVLTEETAAALRRHYGPPVPRGTRARWGQILLAAFGALLVGGGVILILAHNWDILGRPARAALALGLLLAAQLLTLFALVRRPHSAAWTEATSVFLVAACGASLALVGQTYHLGGSFEDLMRGWLWLVILIPYLTGSALAAIGFWSLLVIRIAALGRGDAPWDPWLLVLAGTPFVLLRARSRPESWSTALVTTAAASSTFVVGSVVTIQDGWHGLWAVFQVSLLGALIAAAVWESDGEIAGSWRGRILAPAWIGVVLVGTALTFDNPWRSTPSIQTELRNPNVSGAAVVALACAVFASIVTIRLARTGRSVAAIATAAPFLAVVTHALALSGMDAPGWVVFNLWLLAVGSLTLIEGIRALKLGTANRGLLAISLLLLARFFDSDQSFLARGLAFVTLGSACLALNFWLMRRARTEAS